MLPDDLTKRTAELLDTLKASGLRVATAESCTGGLIAGLLTEFPGSSDVFERGFVTYSNAAKCDMLGVDAGLIAQAGAVSREVALAMAEGALRTSPADLSVAVTGIAGPGGGTPDKPVGLVHVAVACRDGRSWHQESRFGDCGRSEIRHLTVSSALSLLRQAISATTP